MTYFMTRLPMLNNLEYKVLKTLEDGLPLTADPLSDLARRCGLTREAFCETVQKLKERGVIRRISVVLRHHRAGIKGNIMAAFNVPAAKLAVTGERLAQCPQISHCYARKTDVSWPYNLYAMLHAPTPAQANALAEGLCRELEIADYVLLPTLQELKKSSFKLHNLDQV